MSANCLRFLTTSQIRRLHHTHLARAELTQPTYLESAVYSPQQHNNYGEEDLFRLAGVLAEKITLNHAYQDRNKRTALLATDMFLRINGSHLQKNLFPKGELDKKLQSAHVAIATKKWNVEEIAAFYKSIRVSDDQGAGEAPNR
ncbi:hypothetical protein E4U57_008046 [Claviceps arundinis]|uniref:Fido domain-containing protein n=1 Tax=Claviceps arundinis TaxID=1623583 RepID=A0ABQ7PFZ6_9HYPO|nr:hypothetical protein E4U57_008046 [Claviceps arundinis]